MSGTQFSRDLADIVGSTEKTSTITTPKTVQSIREEAFRGAGLLRSAVLNENLETIEDHVFQFTHLKQIALPTTLREIGSYAFSEVYYLDRVVFRRSESQKAESPRLDAGELLP